LWGVAAAFGTAAAVAAWAIGSVLTALWIQRSGSAGDARWSAASQTFRLPGSWVPLALILGIFGVKFGVGMNLAMHPELRQTALFALGASLAYGVFSGIFAGRALVLWRLTQAAR
jgi:hypothetical protein